MPLQLDAGFSIREYTAKVRAVDVRKCWPFRDTGDGDLDENKINQQRLEALLPPITVTKFRWWSHELNRIQHQQEQGILGIPSNEASKEKEKLEFVCPVCGNFAAPTMKAVNAHVDNCLAHAHRDKKRKMRMPMKAKSKSPKKRSIVEIFAVSPQIEKVDDDDDDDMEDDLDLPYAKDVDLDVVKTKHDEQKKKSINVQKKKIKKVRISNKLTVDQKKNRLKKKKKMKMKNKPIANKESAQLSIPVDYSRKVYNSFCSKGVEKDILDHISIPRNKLGLKASMRKKHGIRASTFIAKHRKAVIPVRGILKKNTKLIPQQNSEICNLPSGSQINSCELQHSERHVRFSGKDDILSPKKNLSSNVQNVSNTYPDFASQLQQDHSTENDKQSASVRVNGIGDVSVSTGNGAMFHTMINKKQLPGILDSVTMPDFLSPYQGKEQHISDRSPSSQAIIHDNNLHMFSQGYQNVPPHNPTYAGILRLLPTVDEVQDYHVNSQLCGNVSTASNLRGKSVDYFKDPTHGYAAGDLLGSTRAFSQPSSSDFASIDCPNMSVSFMPQSSIKSINAQTSQYRPYFRLSPTECMGSDYKERVGALSERCIDEEFYGLPLNSHGELMQMSSSGKVGFEWLKKSTLISSTRSYPHNSVPPRSLGDSVIEKRPTEQAVARVPLNLLHTQKIHDVQIPARFGVNELPNTGRPDVHFSNSWTQYGQDHKGTQTIHLKENSDNIALKTVRPTMRLMGKNVAIGRSDTEMQGFEDGKIWMDKDIIQECHPTNILGNSLHKRHIQQDGVLCPSFGKSEETLHYPVETENNQASQRSFWVKVPESRSHPYVNWKSNAAFRNGDLSVNRIAASSQMHPSTCPYSPLDMLYKEANLQESIISGAETVSISSHLPVLSSSLETRPCMSWIPTKINCQQNLPHARKSVFGFPFLHPDCNEHVQSSSFASSSRNPPPGPLHAPIQVKPATMLSQATTDVGDKHYHCTTAGTNFFTAPHHPSVVSHPHSSMVSNPHMKSSPGSAVFVQPPFFPFPMQILP